MSFKYSENYSLISFESEGHHLSPLEHVDEKGKNSCDCDKEDHQAKGPHCSTVPKDDYN